MVKFNDPVVVAQDFRAVVNLWHIVDGLYIWEFVTTVDYEWSVIQGHRPYRWTIWLYSLTRISTLLAMIVNMIGFDTFRPINCQLWVTSEVFFAYFAVANASMLIVLRVIAVWNQNRIVFAISMSTWVANISALIHSTVLIRGAWSPVTNTCVVPNTASSRLNVTVSLFADIILLLIMLVGLLRERLEEGGSSNLACFLWSQGLIWLFLATIAHVPPAVFVLLNLNAPFNLMFQTPGLVTLSIAATRMHRSLTDFGSRAISVTLPKWSSLASSETNRIWVSPIPFRRR